MAQSRRRFSSKLWSDCLRPVGKAARVGLYEYGREGIDTSDVRNQWRFDDSDEGAEKRAQISGKFWETMHIDLRMVDTSDFTIAYCPTNIYSVGTPHEIVVCRQQRKPVLFVSPRVTFPDLAKLKERLKNDKENLDLLESLVNSVLIKENSSGVPSLWYIPHVGGENFFDKFGFAPFAKDELWDVLRTNWDRLHPCSSSSPITTVGAAPRRVVGAAKKSVGAQKKTGPRQPAGQRKSRGGAKRR